MNKIGSTQKLTLHRLVHSTQLGDQIFWATFISHKIIIIIIINNTPRADVAVVWKDGVHSLE